MVHACDIEPPMWVDSALSFPLPWFAEFLELAASNLGLFKASFHAAHKLGSTDIGI